MIGQTLNVNGKPASITVDDPDMPLLYVLRGNLGLHGPVSAAALDNAAPVLFTSTAKPSARVRRPSQR